MRNALALLGSEHTNELVLVRRSDWSDVLRGMARLAGQAGYQITRNWMEKPERPPDARVAGGPVERGLIGNGRGDADADGDMFVRCRPRNAHLRT
jgi:hypothetical protein